MCRTLGTEGSLHHVQDNGYRRVSTPCAGHWAQKGLYTMCRTLGTEGSLHHVQDIGHRRDAPVVCIHIVSSLSLTHTLTYVS